MSRDANVRIRPLVPTFRSSYTISAITFCELRKAMGTSKFMILVPLFDLKSLGSFRRLRCRDFKSAALVPTFRSSYTISAITFFELRKAMGTSKFYDSSAAFRFEVPGFISPLAVQGLQIGGTSAHFPKFVQHFSNHLLRTSESHGH